MLQFRFAATLLAAMLSLPISGQADSLKDPTGCATGSAVANCRKLPPLSGGSGGGSSLDRDRPSRGLSTGSRLRQSSPLPSESIQRGSPPPLLPAPGSTGLGGGSTGLGQ